MIFNRLIFLMVLSGLFTGCGTSNSTSEGQNNTSHEYLMIVSSFDESDGYGLSLFDFYPSSESIFLANDSSIAVSSYLAINEQADRLYSVSGKGIVSFAIDGSTHKLKKINTVSLDGDGACYVSLSADQKFLFVAYYVSGEVASYVLEADGAVGKLVDIKRHLGSSINPDRQEAAHAHMSFPIKNTAWVLVPDLGIDSVKIYAQQPDGVLMSHGAIAIEQGGGPRHVDYDYERNLLFVLHELTGKVSAFHFDIATGATQLINTVSILPEDFQEFNKSADIHLSPDGQYLYASNRGHNSIAICAVSEEGELSLQGNVSSGGVWPRAFALDPSGQQLVVANKRSAELAVFNIDSRTGFPELAYTIKTALAPQCIRFVKK